MKLYYTKGACSLASRIVINEVGLPCDYEAVNLKTKRTETDADFLSINPKGAVPTLITDDNKVLTENAVIQQYVAEKGNATSLLPPKNDFNHYRVLEWQNYVATELHKGFAPIFNPMFPDNVKEEVVMPLMRAKLSYVDKHLQPTKYLLGDDFTLPDAYLFVMLLWAHHFKFDIAKWPYLTRYEQELRNRKAIQQSLQQEGLG